MSESIPEAAHHLLDDPNFAHVATLMHDGTPQTTPVWVAREGDVLTFNTAKGRAKYQNLQRDPRVTVSIHGQAQPYEWIQIRGRAQFADDVDNADIHRMSHKYTGQDYQHLQPGEQRVVVRVVPDAVVYYPPRG